MKKDRKQNRIPFAFRDESFDFQLMHNMSYCIAQMGVLSIQNERVFDWLDEII